MSEQIKNGGPAFPFGVKHTWDNYRGESSTLEENEEGMSLRDYFAEHAPTTMQDAINLLSMLGEKDPMRRGGDLLRTMAQMRYAYADAMLAEGASEHDAQDERDTLSDLQAYFPKAETLHDCYRGIEALEKQRDELLAALDSMMRDTGLVSLMRPDEVERNIAAIATANGGAQ